MHGNSTKTGTQIQELRAKASSELNDLHTENEQVNSCFIGKALCIDDIDRLSTPKLLMYEYKHITLSVSSLARAQKLGRSGLSML